MSTRGRNQLQGDSGGRVSVLVLPLGGALSLDMEQVVYNTIKLDRGDIQLRGQQRLCGRPLGIRLIGTGFITTGDARRIRDKIREELRPQDPNSPVRSLLLVGKSAGGISLWNTLRLHYQEIAGWVQRIALVLVDPHGNASRDGEGRSYAEGVKLTWPQNWSTDTSIFRAYNIFQQRFPGMGGNLTGASFPRAYMNIELTDTRPRSQGGLDHMRITHQPNVAKAIRYAYSFASTGR